MTIETTATLPPSPKPRERRYVRLPANSELFALWKEHGYSYAETAEVIGCTPSAVQQRVRRAGLAKPESIKRFVGVRPPIIELTEQSTLDRLSQALERIEALEINVRKLQNRVKILERSTNTDKISHKRIVDGGEHAQTQRKRDKQPKIA